MKFIHLTRTGSALAVAAAFITSVCASANATPSNVFNVTTTISASCSVTNSGPADLDPTYSPVSDSGTGQATSLATLCTGSSPTVAFTDASGTGSEFVMSGSGGNLFYYLSNNTSCGGTIADNPLQVGTAYDLGSGSQSFNICAAVIAGSGTNTGAHAGTYTDQVTYTIVP